MFEEDVAILADDINSFKTLKEREREREYFAKKQVKSSW